MVTFFRNARIDAPDMSLFSRFFRKGLLFQKGSRPKDTLSEGGSNVHDPPTTQEPRSTVRRSMSAPMALSSAAEPRSSQRERRGALDMTPRTSISTRPASSGHIGSFATIPSSSPLNSYGSIQKIHRGRLATTYLAQDLATRQWVALKVFTTHCMPPSMLEQVRTEAAMLDRVSHNEGVPLYYKQFEDAGQTFIVMEYCPGGTLLDLITNMGGRIPETQAAEVAVHVLATLEFLHQQRVVHRNVKPEHVVRSRGGRWKLLDFANVGEAGVHVLNARVGSLQYMAPEVLQKPCAEEVFHEVIDKGLAEEDLPVYNEKADLWSLGATLFEALTGRQPFLGETPFEMISMINHATHGLPPGAIPPFIAATTLSPSCQSFLAQLLCVDPTARPSVEELRDHPWLRLQAAMPRADLPAPLPLPSTPRLSLWQPTAAGEQPLVRLSHRTRIIRHSLQEVVAG